MQVHHMFLLIIFASTINSHVDVASHNSGIHIALASNFLDGFSYTSYNSENYMQQPMSDNMYTLSFHATSNIQQTPIYTSTAEQIHVPMNVQLSRPN